MVMRTQYDRVRTGAGPGATEDQDPAEAVSQPEAARTGGRNVDVVGTAPPVPDPAVVAAVRALDEQLLETHETLDAFVARLDLPADDAGSTVPGPERAIDDRPAGEDSAPDPD